MIRPHIHYLFNRAAAPTSSLSMNGIRFDVPLADRAVTSECPLCFFVRFHFIKATDVCFIYIYLLYHIYILLYSGGPFNICRTSDIWHVWYGLTWFPCHSPIKVNSQGHNCVTSLIQDGLLWCFQLAIDMQHHDLEQVNIIITNMSLSKKLTNVQTIKCTTKLSERVRLSYKQPMSTWKMLHKCCTKT